MFTMKFTMKPLTQAMFLLSLSPVAFAAVPQNALPTQGQVSQGNAQISQNSTNNAANMTITQSSQQAAINWHSFNIGKDANVTFVQPNAQAATLNRVANGSSDIAGSLNANGHVYLLNPNGIMFSPTAQVNVGSLVASTGSMSDADWLSDQKNISINPQNAASVINQGRLTVAQGGEVVLHAKQVLNNGNIVVENGKVVGSTAAGKASLLAGTALRVNVTRDGLIQSELETIPVADQFSQASVSNTGTITINAGDVTLQSLGNDSVTNHSGSITAQSSTAHKSKVLVLAGRNSDEGLGTTTVSGSIDASAPVSGDGGFVETSAAKVSIDPNAHISTLAKNGSTGTLLIDPEDYTIAASGGDITGASIANQLGSNNVEIQVVATSGSDVGDIYVNDSISYNANKLTLTAIKDIHINADINVGTDASSTATLALNPASNVGSVQGSDEGRVRIGINPTDDTFKGSVNFVKTGDNLLSIGYADINQTVPRNYTVINALGAEGSTTGTDLQGINGSATNLSGFYALGGDIDASATNSWDSGSGFTPIGSENAQFYGVIEGLGHNIKDLNIDRDSADNVGFVGYLGDGGKISNLHFEDSGTGKIIGNDNVGIVGSAADSTQINNVINRLDKVEGDNYVGGILGHGAEGSTIKIRNSVNKAKVIADDNFAGGIAAEGASILSSHNDGTVTADAFAGGLIANAASIDGFVTESYNTGKVQANIIAGGLVGRNSGGIQQSFNTGEVVIADTSRTSVSVTTGGSGSGGGGGGLVTPTTPTTYTASAGGIVGESIANSAVAQSYNTGKVTGGTNTGGLVGVLSGTLQNSYNQGEISGTSIVGGAVGNLNNANMANVYNIGAVTGTSITGGLVAQISGTSTQNDSLYDRDTVGLTVGTTLTQMQDKNSGVYATSWDFGDIWEMPSSAGLTTPMLRNTYKIPLTLTANAAYTGNNFNASNVSLTGTGFINGDTEASLIGNKQFVDSSGSAITAKDVGDYRVSGLYSQTYQLDTTNSKFTVTKATANVSATTGKVYDASTSVNTNLLQVTGVNGETLTLTGNAKTASADAGSQAISTTGLTLTDGTGSNAGKASNYALASSAGNINIAKKALTLAFASKQYDGNNRLTASNITATGINNESVPLQGYAVLSDASTGQQTVVDTSNLSITNTAQARNYSLPTTGLSSVTVLAASTTPTTTTPTTPTTTTTPTTPTTTQTTPTTPSTATSVQPVTKVDDLKIIPEVVQSQLEIAIIDNSSPFSAADLLLNDFEELEECKNDIKNNQLQKQCISKSPIVTDAQLKDDDNSQAVAIQNKYALVIGNSNYQHVTALSGAKNDSHAVSNLLKAKGYQVMQVNDATKSDMISSLNHLVQNTSLHDSVLIYYAGHGYIHQQSQEGYWIPVDAQAASPSRWLANRDIVRFLKNIPAKQIMLVSDSCFSGSFTHESAKNSKQLDDNAVLKRRSAVVISSGDIEVVKDKVITNSPFATEFMDILNQKDKSEIRAKQLSQDISVKLARFYQQKPQYGTLYSAGHIDGGDYILKLK